jgi:hypothetical protein
MSKLFSNSIILSLAVIMTLAFTGTSSAAPLTPSAPAAVHANGGSLATKVHCRVYYHCHRRCWWRKGRRVCRRYCHFCG